MSHRTTISPEQFTTFGELVRFLRHHAGLTQQQRRLSWQQQTETPDEISSGVFH